MKMKLPDMSGKVITIKSDQQEAKRCYENNLKAKRGVFMVTERHLAEAVTPAWGSPAWLQSAQEG